jgi:hypothetical protein
VSRLLCVRQATTNVVAYSAPFVLDEIPHPADYSFGRICYTHVAGIRRSKIDRLNRMNEQVWSEPVRAAQANLPDV